MRLHILLLAGLLLTTTSAYGDGEGDNNPVKVRQVPRVGVEISEEDRSRLNTGLEELAELLEKLKTSKMSIVSPLGKIF